MHNLGHNPKPDGRWIQNAPEMGPDWARDKMGEGLEQSEDRSEAEQRLMFQLLELGWIE